MKISRFDSNDINAVPVGTDWLYWEDASRAYYGPISEGKWKEGVAKADRILAIGVERTVELRRLSGCGWCGRVAEGPSGEAPSVAYAGNNSLREPRLDARQWTEGSPPRLRIDSGVIDSKAQVAWFPFIADGSN